MPSTLQMRPARLCHTRRVMAHAWRALPSASAVEARCSPLGGPNLPTPRDYQSLGPQGWPWGLGLPLPARTRWRVFRRRPAPRPLAHAPPSICGAACLGTVRCVSSPRGKGVFSLLYVTHGVVLSGPCRFVHRSGPLTPRNAWPHVACERDFFSGWSDFHFFFENYTALSRKNSLAPATFLCTSYIFHRPRSSA